MPVFFLFFQLPKHTLLFPCGCHKKWPNGFVIKWKYASDKANSIRNRCSVRIFNGIPARWCRDSQIFDPWPYSVTFLLLCNHLVNIEKEEKKYPKRSPPSYDHCWRLNGIKLKSMLVNCILIFRNCWDLRPARKFKCHRRQQQTCGSQQLLETSIAGGDTLQEFIGFQLILP